MSIRPFYQARVPGKCSSRYVYLFTGPGRGRVLPHVFGCILNGNTTAYHRRVLGASIASGGKFSIARRSSIASCRIGR